MATATRNVNVRIVEETTGYTLDITPEEAKVLHDILRRVGGNPDGRRGVADQVLVALQDADVPHTPLYPGAPGGGALWLD